MFLFGTEIIHNFDITEFPENPIKYADPVLIKNLDAFRILINQKIYPSPVKGALARFTGRETSQHKVIIHKNKTLKKSTAVDVFCEGDAFQNMQFAMKSRLFNGIGVYFDTFYNNQPWVMMHLDIRAQGFREQEALLWFCIKETVNGKTKNKYFYMQNENYEQASKLLDREELYKTYKKEKINA